MREKSTTGGSTGCRWLLFSSSRHNVTIKPLYATSQGSMPILSVRLLPSAVIHHVRKNMGIPVVHDCDQLIYAVIGQIGVHGEIRRLRIRLLRHVLHPLTNSPRQRYYNTICNHCFSSCPVFSQVTGNRRPCICANDSSCTCISHCRKPVCLSLYNSCKESSLTS